MKRHWYSIKIEYFKRNQVIFSKIIEVGLLDQSSILKSRELKQVFSPLIILDPDVKHLLSNGAVAVHPIAYLGKFKGKTTTIKEFVENLFGGLFLPYFCQLNKEP